MENREPVTVDDEGLLNRIVGDLRSYERDMGERLRSEQERAARAEQRAAHLAEEVERLRALEASATTRALEERRAAVELERREARARERAFISALRSYLTEIEQAQQALVDVARKALAGAEEVEAATQSDASGRLMPPPTTPLGQGGDDDRADASMWAPPSGRPVTAARPGFVGTPVGANGGADTGGAPQLERSLAGGSLEATTDEHRLIDLHNRLDLQRVELRRPWQRGQSLRSGELAR